jgi:hypothetical protein
MDLVCPVCDTMRTGMNKCCGCGVSDYEAAITQRDERIEALENACRQALSDLTWIESLSDGNNLQSSILLLRNALGDTEVV